ncbi:hypothetical protein RBB50_007432 [Rhinocladiella similis]
MLNWQDDRSSKRLVMTLIDTTLANLRTHPTSHDDVASSSSSQHAAVKSSPPPQFSAPSPSTSRPSDPSTPHSTLPTFLAHAARTGLSPSSTVYTGTVYEYLTLSTLRAYGFHLHRVGGRGDRGVDLIGHWHVPLLSPTTGAWKEHTASDGNMVIDTETFRVLVQCKRLVGKHAKIGPNLIRELDGAVRGARLAPLFESILARGPEGGTDGTTKVNTPTIGILVGTRPATKGVIESMRRSNRALGWIMMEEEEQEALNHHHLADSSFDVDSADSPSPSTSSLDNGANDHTVSRRGWQDPTCKTSEVSDTTGNTDTDTDIISTRDSASALDAAEASESPKDSNTHTPALELRGRIRQILWNQAARNLGLEDVSVVPRYDSSGREEVVLMRGGRVWGGS